MTLENNPFMDAFLEAIQAAEHKTSDPSPLAPAAGGGAASSPEKPCKKPGSDPLVRAMSVLLRRLAQDLRPQLKNAKAPQERLTAIVQANFGETQFNSPTISAWLMFYTHSRHSPDSARLLRIYHRRLHSNLVHCFHAWPMGRDEAYDLAESAAALIDGAWLRYALMEEPPAPAFAAAEVERRVYMLMGRPGARLRLRAP